MSSSHLPSPLRSVLVIDDNIDAAQMLVEVLNVLGHTAAAANNGKAGIALALALQPDIIFLDIGMPDMDGFEVARSLRSFPQLDGVRIVALTGWRDEQTLRLAADAGFDLHLTKPAPLAAIADALELS